MAVQVWLQSRLWMVKELNEDDLKRYGERIQKCPPSYNPSIPACSRPRLKPQAHLSIRKQAERGCL